MKIMPIKGLPIDAETPPPPRKRIDSPPHARAEGQAVRAKAELRIDPRTATGAKTSPHTNVLYSTVLLCSMEADSD